MVKDVLFIGHATPEDNRFATWLATKLELLGYNVWVDVKSLDPSDDFWIMIEETIRSRAVKFIFVASRTSVLGNRDGVLKELSVADKVKRNNPGFIIPVRIDDVSFSDFPVEIIRLDAIDFNRNWAVGLAKLAKHLEKEQIQRNNSSIDAAEAVERWTGLLATVDSKLIKVPEYYSSNIFPVSLPEHLYIYRLIDVEEIFSSRHYPYRKMKGLALTFVCPNCIESELTTDLQYEAISVCDVINEKLSEVNTFETHINNPKQIVIDIIGSTLGFFLYSKGLRKFKPGSMKTSKVVYFFRSGMVSKRSSLSRVKKLAGKRKNNNWHYALSAYYTDYPEAVILLRSHLIFTDGDGKALSDGMQVSARRSKGATFFNKQWRELLESAMYYLADGKASICVTACCNTNALELQREPVTFISQVGYVEPKTKEVTDDE